MITASQLLEDLDRVFPAEPVPMELIPNGHTCHGEDVLLKAIYSGRTWKEITLERVIEHFPGTYGTPIQSTYELTPEAYRYYMPAMVKMAIEHTEQNHDTYQVAETLEFQLCDAAQDKNTGASLRLYNNEQKRVLAMFLVYQMEKPFPFPADCLAALNNYWGQFIEDAGLLERITALKN